MFARVPCRLEELIHFRQKRFITSQPAEDIFNRGKASMAKSKNEVCNAEHLHAISIDKRVLSKVHRYDEIDRTAAPSTRNAALPDDAYAPALQASKIPKEPAVEINALRVCDPPTVVVVVVLIVFGRTNVRLSIFQMLSFD